MKRILLTNLLKIWLFTFVLLVASGLTSRVLANCPANPGNNTIYVEMDNYNTGTTWEVAYQLLQHQSGPPLSGWMYSYMTSTNCPSGAPFCFFDNTGTWSNSDDAYVKWHTACVDPTIQLTDRPPTCGEDFIVDASCYPNGGLPKYMCTRGADNLGLKGSEDICNTCPVGSCCAGGNRDVCTAFESCTGSPACTYNSFTSCDFSQPYVQGSPVWCTFTQHPNDSRCNTQPGCIVTPTNTPTPTTGSPPIIPTNLNVAPFCRFASGSTTNGASGANFTWSAVAGANSYIITYNGSPHTVSTNSFTIPINPSCNAGPGGCSFSYNLAINWNVQSCSGANGTGCGAAVNGPGFTTNDCSISSSCPSGQVNPHYACSGTTCTSVSGCGVNSCTGPSDTTTCGGGGVTCQQCGTGNSCDTYTTNNCTTNCNNCSGPPGNCP